MNARDYTGLVAAVTGGASGIGLAAGLELASRGAQVIALDVDPGSVPSELHGIRCDVTSDSSVSDALAAVEAGWGCLDVLVNNAGISAVGTIEANDSTQWAHVLNVNVTGIARTTASAMPLLRRSSHAAVVNLCSIAAFNGLPDRALYSASKGAVYALTLAMATDHVREGIRVNCVSPGTVDTPFVARMLEAFADPVKERAALDARQATGRMVTPEEVAAAIAYLGSPLSGSTTGTSLLVDGGVTTLRVRPL